MPSTQFRIKRFVFFARLGPCFTIDLDRGLHNLLQRHWISPGLTISPCRLTCCPKSCPLPVFESHPRYPEEIGYAFAFARTRVSATGETTFSSSSSQLIATF